MLRHATSTESRSDSTSRAVESVIASRSANPDSAAIAYSPVCGKCSFEAATATSTTPYSTPNKIADFNSDGFPWDGIVSGGWLPRRP